MSKISFKFDKKGFEQLYKQLDEMEKWEAEAGYYGKDIHTDSQLPMSNLAWIQENGAVLDDGTVIPERPFMSQSKDAIAGSRLGEKEVANIIFKDKSVKAELDGMSKKMATQISITIEYGDFTPNSPYTLSLKRGDDPLIDSGEMKETPQSKVVKKEMS